MRKRNRILTYLLFVLLSAQLVHAQSYEEYRDTWQGKERARFITYRYDRPNLDFAEAGYVSDRPREWSNNLGGTGENELVDPFEYGDGDAKHVLLMVHGYGPTGTGAYVESREAFFTEGVNHTTGASAWFADPNGPSLYDYLRGSAPTEGFEPAEWVILGVSLNISQGSGLSILENQRRLRALVDLLWHHKQDKIRTISFASHSTGGPVVKGVIGGSDPAEHPWVNVVDDHLNLAGALGGTVFVWTDAPAAAGAPHLRHQLMYGIQHPDDYRSEYKYHAGATAENGAYKRTYRWPEHVDVLSVAGVWGAQVDGDPWSGEQIATMPWNITSDSRLLHAYEGKIDGIVPNTSVIEHVFYKQIDANPLPGDPFEWRHQIAESDRYAVDHDDDWVLPSLQPPGTFIPFFGAGAGSLPLGASSNADNVPAADRYPGEAVTYVEVESQHNGMLHNEHVLRLARRRLGTWTVEPNVQRPVVSGLSRESGSTEGGDQIQIYGSHFRHVTDVRFGDVEAPSSWSIDSETQLTATVPDLDPAAGQASPYVVDVQVVNTAGASEDNGLVDDFRYLLPLEAPSIDPPGGTFDEPAEVILTTDAERATIYYTTNGTEPQPENPSANVYAGPVTIAASPEADVAAITLKARAVGEGYADSGIAEAVFSVDARVEAPTIFPDGGDFTGSAGVTLSSSTPGADIFYTTDGSEPTYNSTSYTGPFQLEIGEHTVRARAYRPGYNASAVSESAFRVYATSEDRTSDPIVYPLGSGQFTDSVYVRMLNHTEGAVIRYTLGQNEAPDEPTQQSTAYTEPFALEYDPSDGQDETTWFVRAKAFAGGLPPSNMIQRSYAVSPALGETAAPEYEPPGNMYANEITVTISSATDNARLYVTTDGSAAEYDPDDRSSESSPYELTLDGTTELRSVAKRPFFSTSDETIAAYVFLTATPEIAGNATTGVSGESDEVYLDSVQVSIASETEGTSIHYTLDGSEPQESSTEYNAPFYLTESATVTARAFKRDYTRSQIVSKTFTIKQAEAPVIVRHPERVETVVGSRVIFRVEADGRPSPDYQWTHDRAAIRSATADSLVIPKVRKEDEGFYHVIAANAAGSASSDTVALRVVPAETAPEITADPVSRTVVTGAVTTFSASASGRPEPSYQWLKDAEPIVDATSSELTLRAVGADDEASYRVIATNTAGSDTSAVASLTVTSSTAPSVTRAPSNVSVQEGDTARFSAEVSGEPAPTFRWLHDEEPLPGETADTLVIPDVQPEDAGTYAVVVTNLAGSDTSAVAELTITTDIASETADGLPERFVLHANYPNPFNPITTITFALPRDGDVTLTVYNPLGQRIAVLQDGPLPAGRYQRKLDFSRFSSGVYLYELRVDGQESAFRDVKTFVLMK